MHDKETRASRIAVLLLTNLPLLPSLASVQSFNFLNQVQMSREDIRYKSNRCEGTKGTKG